MPDFDVGAFVHKLDEMGIKLRVIRMADGTRVGMGIPGASQFSQSSTNRAVSNPSVGSTGFPSTSTQA